VWYTPFVCIQRDESGGLGVSTPSGQCAGSAKSGNIREGAPMSEKPASKATPAKAGDEFYSLADHQA
jgi:hypothetical protein